MGEQKRRKTLTLFSKVIKENRKLVVRFEEHRRKEIGLVDDIKTDETIIMGDSILMVMKGESQNGKRKREEQEQGKFSIHEF